MKNLVPEVQLLICLDPAVPVGATLQAIDLLRAEDWTQEFVLVCDKSWEKYITPEQATIFLDKQSLFHKEASSEESIVNTKGLENFLQQLDEFDIKKVVQVGELRWGRWIKTYLSELPDKNYTKIELKHNKALDVVNGLASHLQTEPFQPRTESSRNALIYMDPYEGEELSPTFIKLVEEGGDHIPSWVNIIAKEKDIESLQQIGLSDYVVEWEEVKAHLFNQFLVCFDECSTLAQASRSYNVAVLNIHGKMNCEAVYVPGDIVISPKERLHFSELGNLLSYWKRDRLKELAFQWMNMGVCVDVVEKFHKRVVLRSVQSYSGDLTNCQNIINKFNSSKTITDRDISDYVRYLNKNVCHDSYALSFSLKLLVMIVERMLAAASGGERLFKRLGSDYHRIIIGEALIEGIMTSHKGPIEEIDLPLQLKKFHQFLLNIDYHNDFITNDMRIEET